MIDHTVVVTTRRWPAPLAPGARIAVVAPSGPFDADRLARGVAIIESWGLSVAVPSAAIHDRLDYLAGGDAARAAEFTAAWTDPTVAAVWAARGGYGVQRMVDLVDWAAVRAAGPKHLLGFSDVTALHTRLGRELGQVTLHAPIAGGVGQLSDLPSAAALQRLLLAAPEPGAELARGAALVDGPAVTGRLVGGNLSLVAADVGVEPAPAGPAIAFFEDVAEEGYRVDRMLTQLLRSGWFDRVVGVVLGDFSDPPVLPDLVPATLADRLGDLGVPVLAGVPVGHGERHLSLPLGAEVALHPGTGALRLVD